MPDPDATTPTTETPTPTNLSKPSADFDLPPTQEKGDLTQSVESAEIVAMSTDETKANGSTTFKTASPTDKDTILETSIRQNSSSPEKSLKAEDDDGFSEDFATKSESQPHQYGDDDNDSKDDMTDPRDSSASGRWTKEEDDALRTAVDLIGARNWRRIASEYLKDRRSDVQCLHRWQKVLRPGLIKGPWTAGEDETIRNCMTNGITRWSEIAKRVPGRIGKQCRERWFNHLDPNIKRGGWTPEEDEKLIEGQRLLGNKWSQIAKRFLPGRPENAVKNRWNAAHRRCRTAQIHAHGVAASLPGTPNESNMAIEQENGSRQENNSMEDVTTKKRRRKSAPKKSKHEHFAGGSNMNNHVSVSPFGGLEGMFSLANLCEDVLDESVPGQKRRKVKESKEDKKARKDAEKATKRAEKKLKKDAEKALKKAVKEAFKREKKSNKKRGANAVLTEEDTSATLQAAAILTAAANLETLPSNQAPNKKVRGSSFYASRPGLPAPHSISTAVSGSSPDMTTPCWSDAPKDKRISPTKMSTTEMESHGLHFLSSIVQERTATNAEVTSGPEPTKCPKSIVA